MKYKIWVSVNALYVGDLNEWVDRKFSLQLLDYISNYTVRKWIPICKYTGRGGIFFRENHHLRSTAHPR